MMDLQRVNAYMSKVEESEKNVLPHEGKRLKTGLDLGTAYIVLVVLDENNQPVACEKRAASVLRDGVVVDYSGACRIVRELKESWRSVWARSSLIVPLPCLQERNPARGHTSM